MLTKKISQTDFSFDTNTVGDTASIKSTFDKYGLVVLNNALNNSLSISNSMLLQKSIITIAADMCNKLGLPILQNEDPIVMLDNAVKILEEKDRKALGQVQGLVSQSLAMATYSVNPDISNFVSLLLGVESKSFIMESFGGFVPNIPSNTSRLYTYHSEQHWLPYRKNFINVWGALFRSKNINEGTMWVKPFSHLDQHEFCEYRGYSGVSDQESYMQYEVIDNDLYQELGLKVEPTDLVLFHQNLLHKSEVNLSNKVGYLYINRFFDVRKDLTISSIMGIRPYSSQSENIGRQIRFFKNK
jgi:hypothetical protein